MARSWRWSQEYLRNVSGGEGGGVTFIIKKNIPKRATKKKKKNSFQQLHFSGSQTEKNHNRCLLTRKLQFCAGVLPRWGGGVSWVIAQRSTEEFLNSVSIRLFAGTPRHRAHFKDFPPDVNTEIIITTRMVTDESPSLLPPAFSRCSLF